jgi:hypothetical protein
MRALPRACCHARRIVSGPPQLAKWVPSLPRAPVRAGLCAGLCAATQGEGVAVQKCAGVRARAMAYLLSWGNKPWERLAKRLQDEKVESVYVDRLERKIGKKVTLEDQLHEIEQEILQETASALRKSEDKVNFALLQLQVKGRDIDQATSDASRREHIREFNKLRLEALDARRDLTVHREVFLKNSFFQIYFLSTSCGSRHLMRCEISQVYLFIYFLALFSINKLRLEHFARRKWPPGGTFLSHWGAEEEV